MIMVGCILSSRKGSATDIISPAVGKTKEADAAENTTQMAEEGASGFKAIAGAHYQERDCTVHPAISTVTKVSIFGSRFPAKSSYHHDCRRSEKYGAQTIATVCFPYFEPLVDIWYSLSSAIFLVNRKKCQEWRNKISYCDWSDTTPSVCFAEKGNLKIDTFATVLMDRPSMAESRSW